MIDAEMRGRVVALLREISRSGAIVRSGEGHDRISVQRCTCPYCGAHRSSEHDEDCELAAVLRELEVGDDER